MANLRLALVGALVLGSVFLIRSDAQAVQVSDIQVTCKKDGIEETFNTGWDSDNEYFADVGDIAKHFCEGGFSSFGDGAEYVSDTLGDGAGRYYTGEQAVEEVEPTNDTSSSPTVSPEATSSPSTSPEPTSSPTVTESPTVSQDTYDNLKAEYDSYKAWAEQAIADYKGTISGYINRIDSLNASISERDKAIADLRARLEAQAKDVDVYKTQLQDSQIALTEATDSLLKALQDLAKSKSDVELQKAATQDLKGQLEASQKRVKELEEKLSAVEARLKEMTDKQTATATQLKTAQQTIDTLTAQLKDANDTIAEQKSKIEQLRAIMENPAAEQNLAIAKEVTEIAVAKLATSEPGSEEYESGLALLAVAAEADDPDLSEEIASLPVVGAVATQVFEAMNDLGNVGSDISPEVRERSEEVVIAGVIVGGQIAAGGAVQAARRAKV